MAEGYLMRCRQDGKHWEAGVFAACQAAWRLQSKGRSGFAGHSRS